MTFRDDVKALIERISPEAICDDCVADKLGLTVRQHANHKTRELAGSGGFRRRRNVCGFCQIEKLVISKG